MPEKATHGTAELFMQGIQLAKGEVTTTRLALCSLVTFSAPKWLWTNRTSRTRRTSESPAVIPVDTKRRDLLPQLCLLENLPALPQEPLAPGKCRRPPAEETEALPASDQKRQKRPGGLPDLPPPTSQRKNKVKGSNVFSSEAPLFRTEKLVKWQLHNYSSQTTCP